MSRPSPDKRKTVFPGSKDKGHPITPTHETPTPDVAKTPAPETPKPAHDVKVPLVGFSRDDFHSFAARLETSEERLELLAGVTKRLQSRVNSLGSSIDNTLALVNELRTQATRDKAAADSLLARVDQLAKEALTSRATLETTKATAAAAQELAPKRAFLVPPLLSYKTKTPGEHKLRVTLGEAKKTTSYELLGANQSGSAVFVLTCADDGVRHVLTQEGDDFEAYQDFSPSQVSLAHMLHICFPKGGFTFSELVVTNEL